MAHSFKDNFSKQSDIYLKYRPNYPIEPYSFLVSLTNSHERAWDCGTGNGQAAIGLAGFYKEIIATDPSEQQIKNAIQNPRVSYFVETAEQTSIASKSIDLLTIANALHWFDFEAFYKEAKRVLKDEGVIAAWAYGPPSISPEIDTFIMDFHNTTLNDYWVHENRLVEQEYTTIPFPFESISAPNFFTEKTMNLFDFIGYLNTWSATQRFIVKNNFNPTKTIFEQLLPVWKDPNLEKKLRWKLTVKAGRMNK